MENTELSELRIAAGLTQADLAKRLGCATRTVLRMESGQSPISDAVAATVRNLGAPPLIQGAEVELRLALATVAADRPWQELTRKQRQALPPGAPGWIYKPWTVLPPGQWIEVLDAPETYKNGAVCTRIRWGSNGLGPPTMNLIGTTANADVSRSCAADGSVVFEPLAKATYRAMKPSRGDAEFLGKDKKGAGRR